jgi:hypothetical protein
VNQFCNKVFCGLVLFNGELVCRPVDPIKLASSPLVAKLNMLLQEFRGNHVATCCFEVGRYGTLRKMEVGGIAVEG